MKVNYLIIFVTLVSILIRDKIACTPVTDVKCSCFFEIIPFCPGLLQCETACKDYSAWYTVCVLNEGDGNHYCECFGNKKDQTRNKSDKLSFLN